ncbi:MAG TPA: chorismate synthase, partial [Parachlamydiaceae bacterium]|nr:chorismate synthase [Parachlamydiaceae bacterium]
MPNSFGTIFKMTTFGESHGSAIGVVIDGCPAGLTISEKEINQALLLRAPGKNRYTTERKEKDKAKILSGVFEGKTTGAPIAVLINNQDADSSKYEPIKNILRPSHANFTYLEKYGIFDHKGGGRASARETACRVIAGAIAEKFLKREGILLVASLSQVGDIKASIDYSDLKNLEKAILKSPLYCPDSKACLKMEKLIQTLKEEGDSIGGVVEFLGL